MTEVRFYHLRNKTPEQAVPELALKALSRDYKILIKLPNEQRQRFYDDWLWRFDPNSFLAHGQEGDPEGASQPVWLGTGDTAPNGATMALVAEGADLPVLENFALVCLVFDSTQQEHLQKARSLWATLKTQDDLTLSYWQQQDDGNWAKQA